MQSQPQSHPSMSHNAIHPWSRQRWLTAYSCPSGKWTPGSRPDRVPAIPSPSLTLKAPTAFLTMQAKPTAPESLSMRANLPRVWRWTASPHVGAGLSFQTFICPTWQPLPPGGAHLLILALPSESSRCSVTADSFFGCRYTNKRTGVVFSNAPPPLLYRTC